MVIVGAFGSGVKDGLAKPLLLSVPDGSTTVTTPVGAVAGTTATMLVPPVPTAKDAASTPPNRTAVAALRLVPVSVTALPTTPLLGVKPVYVGATTAKLPEDDEPLLVATVIGPVVAHTGTVTVSCVLLLTVGVTLLRQPVKVTTV